MSNIWNAVYLNLLGRAYHDFLVLRKYCDEQIANHYDAYEIVKNYGKYKIPFENLNYTKLEAMATDIRIVYKFLRTNLIDDFREFYLKHEDAYKEGLNLYWS